MPPAGLVLSSNGRRPVAAATSAQLTALGLIVAASCNTVPQTLTGPAALPAPALPTSLPGFDAKKNPEYQTYKMQKVRSSVVLAPCTQPAGVPSRPPLPQALPTRTQLLLHRTPAGSGRGLALAQPASSNHAQGHPTSFFFPFLF